MNTEIISLSFDDGWKSMYENVLPILKKSGLKSTQFIISGFLDDNQFPQYMNLDEVKELEKLGHEIGCHTASHRHLIRESQSIIESEILLSLKYLKEKGLNVETFSYPYGEYNETIMEKVKQGFIGARSLICGYNEKINPFLLECQVIKANTSFSQVKRWIDENKNWLILIFHQIDYEGREWSITPKILNQIIDYILEKKIQILTIRDGLKKYELR